MQIIQTKKYTWIHIQSPTFTDIEKLTENYDLHELVIEDLLERNNENKVEVYDNMVVMSLNFAKYRTVEKKYILNPFHILITKTHIITLCKYPSENINILIEKANKETLEQTDNINFDIIYEIISTMYDKTIKGLKRASNKILHLQETILHSRDISQDYMQDLIIKKFNMIALLHIFKPQREMLEELNTGLKELHGESIHEKEEFELYISDLDAKLDKILNNTSKLFETVKSLADSYDTILSIKTNKNIMILTVFTVITGILTLIVGAFGMNVTLPRNMQPLAFMYICISMVIVAISIFALFKKMRRI